MKQPFTLPVFVSIVLEKENKVLLILRTNTGYLDGHWGCPGGSLEKEENLLESALREAQEEIDVIVDAVDLQLIHVIQVQKIEKEILGFYFKAAKWHGEPRVNEPHKHGAVEWFDLNHLPKPMTPPAKQALESYKNQILFTVLEK
jgi:8-oxo-dGTP diphosphatase